MDKENKIPGMKFLIGLVLFFTLLCAAIGLRRTIADGKTDHLTPWLSLSDEWQGVGVDPGQKIKIWPLKGDALWDVRVNMDDATIREVHGSEKFEMGEYVGYVEWRRHPGESYRSSVAFTITRR